MPIKNQGFSSTFLVGPDLYLDMLKGEIVDIAEIAI